MATTALTANAAAVSKVLKYRRENENFTFTVAGLSGNATRAYRLKFINRNGATRYSDLVVTLYDSSGNVLATADDPDSLGVHLISIALQNGSYTARVSSSARSSQPRFTAALLQP